MEMQIRQNQPLRILRECLRPGKPNQITFYFSSQFCQQILVMQPPNQRQSDGKVQGPKQQPWKQFVSEENMARRNATRTKPANPNDLVRLLSELDDKG